MAASLFFGEFVRRLDDRFRVSIPAELTEGLVDQAGQIVMVKEQSGALSLWNAESWNTNYREDLGLLQQKLQAGRLGTRRADIQALSRMLSTRHRELTIAGRSRVLIPEGFREFLGVEPGSEAMVIGAGLCIELWHPDAWHAHIESNIPGFQQLFDSLTQ